MDSPDIKEKSEAEVIPLREGLIRLREKVKEIIDREGNVVIIVEGAWGTGKTTLSNVLQQGINNISPEQIKLIIIDNEDLLNEKSIFEIAKEKGAGRNLIEITHPHAHTRPIILIIDGATAGRVLVKEASIDPRNVIRVNIHADKKTQWNNLYLRGYPPSKILKVMGEYPSHPNPEADLNIDNSLQYRIPQEEIHKILTEESSTQPDMQ